MSLGKRPLYALLLAAVFCIPSTVASSASAADWSIEGKTLSGSEAITSSGGPMTMKGKILGTPASVECKTEVGKGSIVSGFTDEHSETTWEACVMIGPTCKVSIGKTEKWKTIGFTFSGKRYESYVPFTGTTLLAFAVTGCALEGKYSVKGSFCGEAEPLNVELVEQPVRFSATVEAACKEAGMFSGLTWNGEAATLAGSTKYKLSGANVGKKWGAK
jgi:hypothetical protein